MDEIVFIEDIDSSTNASILRMGIGIGPDRFLFFQEETTGVFGRIRFLEPIHWTWIQLQHAEWTEARFTRRNIELAFTERFGFGGLRLPIEEPHLTVDLIRFWLQTELPSPKPSVSWAGEFETRIDDGESFLEWYRAAKARQPRRLAIEQAVHEISDQESQKRGSTNG